MLRPQGLPAPLCDLERTAVMGIVNVTPDSFADDIARSDPGAAIAHGLRLADEGADLIDVGGESTRPGAAPVSVDQEAARVLPVVAALVGRGIAVSIDTMHAQVARSAVEAGACLVNDVSGGLADPAMHATVAALRVPYVLMHWRRDDDAAEMTHAAVYDEVVPEVIDELRGQLRAAIDAGIDPARIAVDPGLGFAKEAEHNWAMLHALPEVQGLGHPVLVGGSRKRFLGSLLADASGAPRPPAGRDAATDAISAIAAFHEVWAVRVHDVAGTRDAVRVAQAWRRGRA